MLYINLKQKSIYQCSCLTKVFTQLKLKKKERKMLICIYLGKK